jgi:hypothetical protein
VKKSSTSGREASCRASVPLRGGHIRPLRFELEERPHAKQGFARRWVFGDDGRLSRPPPAVAPAAHLLGWRVVLALSGFAAKDRVVDGMGVGLDLA